MELTKKSLLKIQTINKRKVCMVLKKFKNVIFNFTYFSILLFQYTKQVRMKVHNETEKVTGRQVPFGVDLPLIVTG